MAQRSRRILKKAPPGTAQKFPWNLRPRKDVVERSKQIRKKAPPGTAQALFNAYMTPVWGQHAGSQLISLPGEIRNWIYGLVLETYVAHDIPERKNSPMRGMKHYMFRLDVNRHGKPFSVPSLFHTCRQIRYECGSHLFSTAGFFWTVPNDWNASVLTYLQQFAVSVGAQGLYFEILFPTSFYQIANFTQRWANLMEWAKDVFNGESPWYGNCINSEWFKEHSNRFYGEDHYVLVTLRLLSTAFELRKQDKRWAEASKILNKLRNDKWKESKDEHYGHSMYHIVPIHDPKQIS